MQIKLSFCIGCKKKPEVIPKTSKKVTPGKKKENNVEEEKVVDAEQDVPGYKKITCPEKANYFNIKYMLLPTLEEYIIECMYFDNVAKIYTSDNDIIIKTHISDNIIWICFTIIHLIHSNLDEYLNLMSFNIEIKLTEGALSERVTTDPVRLFYFAENVRNTEFIEIYDYVNETDTAANICKHVMDDLFNLTCSWVDKKFFLSKLYAISDIMHKKAINKLMENIVENKFIIPKPAIDVVQIQDPDLNVKQKKNTKVKKSKAGGPLIVLINGSEFFIDEFVRREVCNSTAKANCCYFGLTCTTRYQLNTYEKCVLNPLVVKLYSIKNLPIEKLQREGINIIYAMYEIPSHPKTITNGYLIKNITNNKLRMNDFHLFPTNRIESLNFIEYFQSHTLDIDFYGLRNVNSENNHLFGEDINDNNLSKKLTPTEAAYILSNANKKAMHIPLFRLKIKLNELFIPVDDKNYPKENKNFNGCVSTLQKYNNMLKAPLNILSDDCVTFIEPDYEKNQAQTNRNLCVRILENKDLLTYNIKVEYRVKVYTNLNNRFYHALTSNAPIYHRLFIKLDKNNLDIYKSIVTRIVMWNNVVYDLKRDGLSGFVAINDEYTLLFVEGLHNSYINKILSMIYDKKINNSDFFYDSKLLYTKRIYIDEAEDFFDKPKIFFTIQMGGCYTKILNDGVFFTTTHTCEKIIRKIDILSKATSMLEICQNNLLPTLSMMKSLKMGNSLCDINLLFKEESFDELLKSSMRNSISTIVTIDSNCCVPVTSKTFLHQLQPRLILKTDKDTDNQHQQKHVKL